MSKVKEDRTLRIKYVFPEDYNPKYVNGAYGFLNHQGEIIANFYLERAPLLRDQYHEIKDGLIGEEIIDQRIPDANQSLMLRYVEHGVVWNYQSAKSFHHWLGQKIKKIEELQAGHFEEE